MTTSNSISVKPRRRPIMLLWYCAQCRGTGPPEQRGPFHPLDGPRTRYFADTTYFILPDTTFFICGCRVFNG
jgi:hypothetical protein